MRSLLLLTVVLGVVVARRKDSTGQEDFEFVEDSKDKDSDRTATTTTTATGKGSLVWILDPDNELCSLLRCGQEGLCLLQDRFTAVCVNKDEAARYGDRIVPAKDANSKLNSQTSNEDAAAYGDNVDYDDDEDDDDYLDDEDDEDEDEKDDDVVDENEDNNKGKTNPPSDNNIPKLNRRPFARKQCSTCPVVRPVFLCGSDNKTYSSLCRLHYHNCLHDANVRIACKGFCPCKDPNSHAAKKERQRKRLNAYMNKLHGTVDDTTVSSMASSSTVQSDHKNKGRDATQAHDRAHNTRTKSHKKFSKANADKTRSNHVKYGIKYSKKNNKNSDKYWAKKRDWPDSRRNDVTTFKSSNSVWGTNECSQEALEAMGNRMLDWFSVIMADSRRRPANSQPGPSWCKREVSWMLGHLDQDNDQKLSVKELYRLEHDDRERCIKPFIDRCDLDRDLFLSGREWCKCFDKSERPCAALRKASKDLLGGYVPECDNDGFYQPTQCHVSAAMCWCVDKHGVEITGSRTRGTPSCDLMVKNRRVTSNHIDDDTENDSDDVDTYEGSADMPLDI